jgi:hypothetical protein
MRGQASGKLLSDRFKISNRVSLVVQKRLEGVL